MFLCSPVTSAFVIVVYSVLGSYVLAERDIYNKIVTADPPPTPGLYPGKVNVAARARVWANATCGERRAEEFCRLATDARGGGSASVRGAASARGEQCAVCDARSSDPNKRHLATYAVDGSAGRWWQSPTLQQGAQYQFVTFTLDLKQEYQISDVIVKSGVSPRPGNWILEKSRDGETWHPWHYFAISDDECWQTYGVRPAPPHPTYKTDSEVVCTSYYSKIKPLEGGEIHTNLVSGRPRVNASELDELTRARYVRLRLQKLRASAEFMSRTHRDPSLARKLFYSIRDIIVSGQCICLGHATKCKYNEITEETQCDCLHNTCGAQCDRCCPLANQTPWLRGGVAGGAAGGVACEPCQCHGHASSCHYDEQVAQAKLSVNVEGVFRGGGVCDNCTDETTGINCEQCKPGWFRPSGVSADAAKPCVQCDCHLMGSTGLCANDDSQAHLGKPAGSCECHEGFGGLRCDKCALGFEGFPDCRPCPCDHRGVALHASCDNGCKCKDNVEGERCDKCKTGFFLLDRDNPKGCMECYCSGVSSQCEPASGYKLQEISSLVGWLVSDIWVRRTVLPSLEPETGLLSIGNFELPAVENYFWLAPPGGVYCGDRLASYGSALTFRQSWVVMRGDTSGTPTQGPDVVLIGANGLKLGFGANWYQQNNISLTVQLQEQGWYHLALAEGEGEDDDDVTAAFNRFGFKGPPVTRAQFLSVLADLKHVLLRAKFHTDQAEASLISATLETGDRGGFGPDVSHLEQCACPEGYQGLSCQACAFGYTRITPEGRQHAICSKCNCHSHAATCHPVTGECSTCEHNTTGAMCERCQRGYYGNAQLGRHDDCRRCACPLAETANNFSPTCETDSHGGYVCTQCPIGYQGNHCQECAVGYFGNPMTLGSTCEPCECKDGGPCDQLTGQCLRCHGNTEGWRCERCKPQHYGDAQLSDCKPCDCDIHGSVNSECNEITGQCQCKERYVGRSCNQCQDGLGNVTAGCVPCQCDEVGSASVQCDTVSGDCQCRAGVAGPHCSQCQPNHYGFSTSGCHSCDCNFLGSKSLACDLETGECQCKDNVVGRTCDTCQTGYWGLSETGCQPCACDVVGSLYADVCDAHTGQCHCKPGVEGRKCEKCAQLFYGLSTYGCSECDICDKPGHICDPDTGRCVCPPLTEGADCSRCQPNSWGYAPQLGCKQCNCDTHGSLSAQCNMTTGDCACAEGFEGTHCNRCAKGYYAFPHCRPCQCHVAGTRSQHCHHVTAVTAVCHCDAVTGQCPCKENVIGQRCDECKPGTFGLEASLEAGCLECFCFGRTAQCSQAGSLVWTQLRTPHARTLLVAYDSNTTQFAPASSLYPVNTREICYINLAVPGGGEMSLNGDDVSKWNVTNNLRIIPGDLGDVEIGVNFLFDSPLYWQLPQLFLKDKILSYGGFLRFTVETEGSTRLLPPAVLATYPLVQIQGNNKIILEHFPILHNPSSRHEVRFHESLWKMKNNPSIKVTRQMLMIALQNLQHILIRATDTVDFSTALLRDVTLDTAVEAPTHHQPSRQGVGQSAPARGVEVCECPSPYNATSCQNPSLGFFRYKGSGKDTVSSTIFIQLVGEARPCECNNRSTVCDIETGHCLNCSDSTGGAQCERCADGHYGSPDSDVPCRPCPCPDANRNRAVSCDVNENDPSLTRCHCQEGYTGKRCERCSYGWYGYPLERDGACVRCECNMYGSVSDECDEETGQCNCRPGITARDCSQCQPRHILTPKGCTSCDDGCTGLLLDKMDHLEQVLADGAGHLGGDEHLLPPWAQLMQADTHLEHAQDTWLVAQNNSRRLELLPADQQLSNKARQLLNKAKKLEKNCHNTTVHALVLKEEADVLLSEINGLENESKGIVSRLQSYGLSENQLVSVVAALKEARQHLARIRDTDLEPNKELTMRVLTYCNTTLNELKEKIGDKERLNSLKDRLNKLLEQIADMKLIVTGVMGKSNEVIKLNDKNRQIYKNVGKTVELSLGFEEDVAKLMRESTELKNLASVLLGEAEDNIEALRRSSDDLKVLTKAVEEREGILFNLNPAYKEKYVIPAQTHANNLMEQAQKYAELFVPTRQDADFALKASAAYEDIVNALQSAKQAATNASAAADIAHEQAYPGIGGRDSLLDDASATGVQSRQLLEDAKQQLAHTFALHDQLHTHKAAVDSLRRNVTSASLDDNSVFRQLQKLSSDEVMQTADTTLARADELTETAAKVKETADDIKKAVLANLKPQLDKLEGLEDISLNNAKDMISSSQENVKKAQQLLVDISSKAESDKVQFNAWNESVTTKLQALRNKITQARHIADGIRLSLTSRGERGSCIRTYEPSHLEPTTMTSIVLTYAISSQQRDALLFYLPSTTTDDFVAIEMVNRKMRFVWNMGGGVGEVTHPMHIQTAGDLSQDQHWYRVEAERISNVGRLIVRPQVMPPGSMASRPVQNASTPGVGRLDVRRGDLVWVGGLPSPTTAPPSGHAHSPPGGSTHFAGDSAHFTGGHGQSPGGHAHSPHPALLSTQKGGASRGLVGCLHRLMLDGRSIGLWNFRGQSQQACTACIEGAEEVVEEQAFSFSGDSYAVLTYDSSSAYNKYVFSVSLSFRTLDENALLFHAVGEHPDRYITLTLREGRVVFLISYGSEWTLETSTHAQYNTGNWTRLEASRYYDRKNKVEKGVLKVDDEVRDGSPQHPPSQDAIPDLSGARFYFGGLAPGYHLPPPPPTTALPPGGGALSFLGCMSDVQVMQEGYNLLKGKFWGVQAACSSKPLTVAGFHGDGFLQLASHHLKRKASFGFIFATAQQDALLMLSTFEGLDSPIDERDEFTNTIEQEQDRLNYYTASLRRGQIEVRLNAGRGEVRLASTGSEYGDSRFHSVAVAKMGRRLELRVDDVVQATATLPEGATVVKAPPPHQGGLYFGGLPPGYNTTGRTISNVPLVGTIKDAIFNDQLLHFDQPVSFYHAQIGRTGPNSRGGGSGSGGGAASDGALGGNAEMAAAAPMPGGTLGCRKVSSYQLQPGAVKFGDSPHTHVHMHLRKRATLQKNYTLELHFRTYYPDGLIFIVPGTPQKRMHYMMGALRNGRLQIVVKGRRKTEMTAQAVLNDGAWHHMTLEKEDRKMTLSVDSIDPEKTKTPKKMNIGPIIYLGGIPEGATTLPDSLVSKLPSFKGCMQGMKLNGHMEDLVGDKVKSHKVGQCFPQVERGSYFPGDAYAIYEKKFNVGNLLELELEFRTSEMNGILLSVSQPENYPALSLELHNGKVVMQGDMGDRRPFVVEESLVGGSVCDNRWHRIEASLTDNDKLTLKLDQQMPQKYWLSDNGHLTATHTNSPLYIGGLPDQASAGMLRSRENFKGCIRNVMIGGERRDWTQMAALHNILLGSCPLPS